MNLTLLKIQLMIAKKAKIQGLLLKISGLNKVIKIKMDGKKIIYTLTNATLISFLCQVTSHLTAMAELLIGDKF